MKRFCTLGGVWLVTLLMTGCQDACDYQGYRDLPLVEVTDGDTTDTSTNPGAVIVGSGTCADPLTQDGTWIAYMEGSGKIASFAKALSPEGCAKPSDVDGDAESEADAEPVADGDTGDTDVAADGDSDAEPAVDGDTDAEPAVDGDTDAEPVVDGDNAADAEPEADTETDGEGSTKKAPALYSILTDETVSTLGQGPEVVVKVPLGAGDLMYVTFGGPFDGIIYVRQGGCDATANACLAYSDNSTSGFETLSFTAPASGDFFVILDSNTLAPKDTDVFTYSITVTRAACTTTNPPAAGMPGAACTTAEKKKCITGECLDKDNNILKQLGDLSIPNGYCGTSMFCNDENSSAAKKTCTLPNGICINGGFVKTDFGIVNICLRPCVDKCDCRVEDGQSCVDPMGWVKRGLLTEAKATEYFKGKSVCVPGSLISLLEQGLKEAAAGAK